MNKAVAWEVLPAVKKVDQKAEIVEFITTSNFDPVRGIQVFDAMVTFSYC